MNSNLPIQNMICRNCYGNSYVIENGKSFVCKCATAGSTGYNYGIGFGGYSNLRTSNTEKSRLLNCGYKIPKVRTGW